MSHPTARNALILAGLGLVLLTIAALLAVIGWGFAVLAYMTWTLASSRMAMVWGACSALCFWGLCVLLWGTGHAVYDVLRHPVVPR